MPTIGLMIIGWCLVYDDGDGGADADDAGDVSADDPAVGLRGCSSCLSTTIRLGAEALTSD